jgi:hypothetical protein
LRHSRVPLRNFNWLSFPLVALSSPSTSTTTVVAGECARPQLPPPCDASSQSSSSLPPCRSGCRFSAIAAHSWPLRSPSLPLAAGATFQTKGRLRDYQTSKVLTNKRWRGNSKSSSGSNPKTSVDTYSTLFSSSMLLLHIYVLMKLQFIFFFGTLQVQYGSLTIMHVAMLIVVMVLA